METAFLKWQLKIVTVIATDSISTLCLHVFLNENIGGQIKKICLQVMKYLYLT